MAPRIGNIASYATQEKYLVDFFGDEFIVTVTPDPSVIGQWIHDVLLRQRSSSHPLVVGVGVQWTPSGYQYDPPADTLQLCVGYRCIIIQLSHCNRVPNILYSFLADPETTFVGVWNSQDARKLEESKHQLEIGELLDLRKYVVDSTGRWSLRGCSFEVIVEECLGYRGVRLDRQVSMSDWSAYDLCHRQILQASLDVYVCYKLGVKYRLWQL
ncbi:hypothetical protein CARUB_v10014617mg [Capsella rubella]|uniref:3'-5' exonuclease domain-containing protein n=1 Tax=Capsella rubella TaxID=81985 RepID=R0I503_9BRAS|nr:uncharacterized protein LOC17892724 [Capsella rubella]EOA31428.1 hypothetical protein CARUB_v10014617mg [Capsella rubella]